MCPFLRKLAVLSVFAASATLPAEPAKMDIYRCTDAKGKVSLQDMPCVIGSQQETIRMARPVDAPPPARPAAVPPSGGLPPAPPMQIAVSARPPPDLFRCTDFDGNVRDSEVFDRNPRCVPLWVLGFRTHSNACTWVEDSCVRYEGRELCNRWRERLRQAELDLRHSPSSRTPFLRSEVARIEQIVRTSCR
jgi:hypothetical protein